MKQEVILYSTVVRPMSGPSRLIRQGKKSLPAPQRLMPSDIAMENNTWHQVVFRRHFSRFADCCRQINSERD